MPVLKFIWCLYIDFDISTDQHHSDVSSTLPCILDAILMDWYRWVNRKKLVAKPQNVLEARLPLTLPSDSLAPSIAFLPGPNPAECTIPVVLVFRILDCHVPPGYHY